MSSKREFWVCPKHGTWNRYDSLNCPDCPTVNLDPRWERKEVPTDNEELPGDCPEELEG